jgi:hypothetical protein
MPQQAGSDNPSIADAVRWKRYAAGACDFVADSPNGKTCARLVILLAAGDLTSAFGPGGEAAGNMPLTGLPAGYRHQGATSGVVSTAALVAYW